MSRAKWSWSTLAIWLLIFLVIGGDVARRPLSHTTTPTYRLATAHWWAGIDPYTRDTHSGFMYLPQAAILFSPFTWEPYLIGELLWRAAVFALFAYALWRLARFFIRREEPVSARTYFFLSLLAVPSAMASLRNAQFDLPLAAFVVLSAAELAEARWNWAAFWLCFGLALKPLMIVPLLLFGALFLRRLALPLLIGLILMLLLPFLNPHPGFVAHEYVRCAQTLLWAAQPHEPKFSDLPALFSHLHVALPDRVWTGVRVVFALIFLGLGAAAVRSLARPHAAWVIGALSATYLMLFNPRTETCSFVFLAPFTASLALLYWRERRGLAYALGLASLCLACDAIPVVHYATDRWLKPLVALLFIPVIIEFILTKKATSRAVGPAR